MGTAPDAKAPGRGVKKKAPVNDYYKPRNQPLRATGRRTANMRNRSRGSLKKKNRSKDVEAKEARDRARRRINFPEGDLGLTVGALAEILEEKAVAVVKFCMTDLGVMAGVSQTLDRDTAIAVAEGFGRIVAGSDADMGYDDEDEDDDDDEDTAMDIGYALDEDDPDSLVPRAPVVTIMGHVDHGKTSLLDSIRDTRVTAGEAGGITQHIAAYQVEHEGTLISFIDTPGHAAFSDMRQRGADVTDIVVLVVAADDGVKEQTADSIACARQAGVPIVVAVNKCDLETADPSQCKTDLASYDVLVEELGGDILCAEVSAKAGSGIDALLTKLLLQAEVLDLKSNPDRDAQGVVLESRVEKGLGMVATTLIQRGTIRVGDAFIAGEASGRVRALIAADGKTKVEEAGPSVPITVVGMDGVPAAGDIMVVADDEQTARELAANRQRLNRSKRADTYQSALMDSVRAMMSGDAQKERREMCVVVKADVKGSAEALSRAFSELTLENEETIVAIKVLVADVGEVTKTDVTIASVTPDTTIVAFNVASTMAAMDEARMLNVPVGYYDIIYDAIDSIECQMQEILSPTPEGEYVGKAVVQEIFNIGGLGNVAGSKCLDGKIRKGSNVRVMRGDKILCEAKVKTLRNLKTEVEQIEEGVECGIGLEGFEIFEVGDIIESYVVAKKK